MALEAMFSANRNSVFYSKQLEVIYERRWFHWITNRALRRLAADGVIQRENRVLAHGGGVTVMWHRAFRYNRRAITDLVGLVSEYGDPAISHGLGFQGEALVLDGFARRHFYLHDRHTRSFQGNTWTTTAHNLDFIFERDNVVYGIEVKNMLSYMDVDELWTKIEMCQYLGIRPVFVARVLPKSWIDEVRKIGGFSLILGYQLYPLTHMALARRIRGELGLPVDTPRALNDGTMQRFENWHLRNV